MNGKDVKGFFEDCKTAAKEILEHVEKDGFIPIFCHNDPDGVTAGSILAKAVYRAGGDFLLRVIDRIDEKTVNEVRKIPSNFYVFAEIGSGYLDLLKPLSEQTKILVIDHHRPLEVSYPNLTHVNPMLHGIDGAKEISGSGVCYFVAKNMGEENLDQSCLAIVGALGDLQDRTGNRCLESLNKQIVEEAEKRGLVEVTTDLLFYGRETRPIHKAIATTMNPFIPGLSGEEDVCLGFIVNLGIPLKKDDHWRSVADLTHEEKQKIFSELTIYLSKKGFSGEAIFQLIGCVYTFLRENKWTPLRDAREFASILNACLKMGRAGVAVALCLGNRGEALDEAQNLLNEYRKTIGHRISLLFEKPQTIVEFENMYLVRCHGIVEERILSPIATILSSSGGLNPNKPIIALTKTEDGGRIKVSARANQTLVDKGLNLGVIMQNAAQKVGGQGGGHNIAAGATIPANEEENFVKFVSQMIGLQR
ncbi:MAG: DHH family phosphoesterase [Candidatus Hecatellales archaeon]|nr:MAG: DHH family phosphoesterase [Candidatus Hecatellales archaeon]